MRIKAKLNFALLSIMILSLGIIGAIILSVSENEIKDFMLEEESSRIRKEVAEVERMMGDFSSDVMLIGQYPPVQGIIRSREEGVDPLDGSSYGAWKERLESIFTSIMAHDPYILQLRYLDEEGNEIVRVGSEGGVILSVPEDRLQNKAQRDYFQETMKIKEGDMYISDFDLNKEQGKIESPIVPVVRFAAPIFDEKDGARRGIIVINVLMSDLIEEIITTQGVNKKILIDQEGYFLIHPDEEKEYAGQLGNDYNFFTEQSRLLTEFKGRKYGREHDIKEKEFLVWGKIDSNPHEGEDFWVILSVIPEKEFFAPIRDVRKTIVWLGLFASLIIMVLGSTIAGRISRPLQDLTNVSEDIRKDKFDIKINPKLKGFDDEVGVLANSFEHMVSELKKSRKVRKRYEHELEGKIKQRTRKLNQKVKELDKVNLATLNIMEDMDLTNRDLAEARKGLKQLNIGLERRVKKRTKELRDALEEIKEANEKLRDLDVRKTEFISIASHELRTPLTPILGYAQLLKNHPEILKDKKAAKEKLDLIFQEARHLHSIINDILNLSKMESGKLSFDMGHYDLKEIIKSTIKPIRIVADKKRISLFVAYDKRLPLVLCDNSKVAQVISNLLNNAIKFAPENGKIKITCKRKDKFLEVAVTDDGIGIARDKFDRLFKPFSQIDSGPRREYEGTGLGLAIAKKIIDAHEGRIWVESGRKKKGSTFYFTLPVAPSKKVPAHQKKKAFKVKKKKGRKG